MKVVVFNISISRILSGDIAAPVAVGDTIVMEDGNILSVGSGGDTAG